MSLNRNGLGPLGILGEVVTLVGRVVLATHLVVLISPVDLLDSTRPFLQQVSEVSNHSQTGTKLIIEFPATIHLGPERLRIEIVPLVPKLRKAPVILSKLRLRFIREHLPPRRVNEDVKVRAGRISGGFDGLDNIQATIDGTFFPNMLGLVGLATDSHTTPKTREVIIHHLGLDVSRQGQILRMMVAASKIDRMRSSLSLTIFPPCCAFVAGIVIDEGLVDLNRTHQDAAFVCDLGNIERHGDRSGLAVNGSGDLRRIVASIPSEPRIQSAELIAEGKILSFLTKNFG